MSRPEIGFFDLSVLKQPPSLADDTIFHIAAEVDSNRKNVRYVPFTVRTSKRDELTLRHYMKQAERFTHQSSQLGPHITPIPAYIVQKHHITTLDAAQHYADMLFHTHTTNNKRRNLLI